jgi:hypothetical protein
LKATGALHLKSSNLFPGVKKRLKKIPVQIKKALENSFLSGILKFLQDNGGDSSCYPLPPPALITMMMM